MDSLVPQDVPLYPGDMVDVTIELDPSSPYVSRAVAAIKQELSSDPRWRYQGSRRESGYDIDQVAYDRLIVTVQIADPAKVVDIHTGEVSSEPLQAGTPGQAIARVAFWLGAFIAAMYGSYALVQNAAAMKLRSVTINGIVFDPNAPDDVRTAALNAMAQSRNGVGQLGGPIVLLALALLAYLLFGGHR